MSEPSYYGTMAALYGATMLVHRYVGARRIVAIGVALGLLASALMIVAKTILVVAGLQIAVVIFTQSGNRLSRSIRWAALGGAGVTAWFLVQSTAVLNVEENLSSANRLGSPLLAFNAIGAGYGLSGIGIGQFHFFYRDEFAPDFLHVSAEAIDQMAFDAPSRASTYNFYARVFLECGVVGLAALLVALAALFRMALPRNRLPLLTFLAGALGFLLTQDTYLYPPLILAVAMILGTVERVKE